MQPRCAADGNGRYVGRFGCQLFFSRCDDEDTDDNYFKCYDDNGSLLKFDAMEMCCGCGGGTQKATDHGGDEIIYTELEADDNPLRGVQTPGLANPIFWRDINGDGAVDMLSGSCWCHVTMSMPICQN